ncbi:Parathyroid hormone/parathyroid hormone-related peptide receptor [Mactra antiquata]
MRVENNRKEFEESYCNVTWDEMLCWDAASAGSFVKQNCPSHVEGIRSSAFAYRECGLDGVWIHTDPDANVTTGWTNYSECFSEDPEFASIKNDLTRIELMSNIGYAISLVSLMVAVLIMLLSRRLHCKSNSLHINLFISFIIRAVVSLLKDVLFVDGLGLQQDVTRISPEKVVFKQGMHWECKLLVSIFMYAVAASMMWIFMEGLYLHMLVYKTLFTERTGIRMYVVIGWLSPLLYVVPWIFVRVFVDNTFCWNTDSYGYLWIIKSPIILTIMINFVFFINIVRVLCIRMKSHRNMKGTHNQQLRKLAKFSLVLIPLFGVLYIGTSAYPPGVDIRADMIYLYCEMFYNSFQGILLAVLFCFLNEEVHNELRRCWYKHRRGESTYTRTYALSSYNKASGVSHSSYGQTKTRIVNKHDATFKRLPGTEPTEQSGLRTSMVNHKSGIANGNGHGICRDNRFSSNDDIHRMDTLLEE